MSIFQTKIIIILGMHRSGTSMTAGVLNLLGVNMGNIIRRKSIHNPLGYFEDIDFVNLNRLILNEAGGSWINPPSEDSIRDQKTKFNEKISDLIKTKPKLWGWKDPRTCLTIELFLSHISNAYFIVCNREHKAIALSLFKRYKMKYEKSLEIIRIYEERLSNFFNRFPSLKKLNVYYEKTVSNPQKWVKEIIKFIEIKVNNQISRKAIKFIQDPDKLKNLSKIIVIRSKLKSFIRKHLKFLYFILKKINFF